MTKSLKEDVFAKGSGFISALEPSKSSERLAGELGEPLVPWNGGLVQQLIPRQLAAPNTYSGLYGLGKFPFHTDLAHWQQPPRYLMLRCIKGYVDVPTLLIDGIALVENVTADVLSRAVVKPRRPQRGTIPLLRLYEAFPAGYRLRWDETFLKPASKIGEVAFQRTMKYLVEAAPQRIWLESPGDTVIIDNWRMLHARSPIPTGCEDRNIERIYLEKLL